MVSRPDVVPAVPLIRGRWSVRQARRFHVLKVERDRQTDDDAVSRPGQTNVLGGYPPRQVFLVHTILGFSLTAHLPAEAAD